MGGGHGEDMGDVSWGHRGGGTWGQSGETEGRGDNWGHGGGEGRGGDTGVPPPSPGVTAIRPEELEFPNTMTDIDYDTWMLR